MPKLLFCILSRGISVDQATNAISLFELVEGQEALQFPASTEALVFLAAFQKSDSDAEKYDVLFKVELSGEALMQQGIDLDFGGKTRTHLIVRMGGIVVPKAGELKVSLEGAFDGIASASFEIKQSGIAAPGAGNLP